MRSQTIVWTAVPPAAGTPAGGQVRISVHVAARLRTDEGLPVPTLAQFPDLVDWPQTLAQVTWAVDVAGARIPATVAGTPRSDLWQALFTPDTFVRPQTYPDLHTRKVRSYPVRHIVDFILARYAEVAVNSGADFPSYDTLTGPGMLGPITYSMETGTRPVATTIEEILDREQAVPPGPPDPPADFYQVRRFHQPRGAGLIEVSPPEFDFHQVVALIGDYPVLQRMLGLVVELDIPAAALTGSDRITSLSVVPTWHPRISGTSTDQHPRLRCAAPGDGTLTALPRDGDPDLLDGHLPLSDPDRYAVVTVDPDGAAIKAMDLANSLQHSRQHTYAGQPQNYSLASLRSGGFSVARIGRATALIGTLRQHKNLYDDAESGQPVLLDAEDITRGYRVDVLDVATKRWQSLQARHGRYDFVGTGVELDLDDEGTLIASPTAAADGSSPDLYLQESLFQWTGWSLAAPKPGTAIDPHDEVDPTPGNRAATAYPLEVRFRPQPGSLPRLRFGRTYRFRMRAVDITGSAPPFVPDGPGAPGDAALSPPRRYGRYEPVNAPVLAPRRARTAGEDGTRLVIRSTPGEETTQDSQLHVVPPQSAQLVAEQHGRFDTAATEDRPSTLDVAAWGRIGAREAQTLDQLPEAQRDPGQVDTFYYDVDELRTPYLPDPVARGAAFAGLPGFDGVLLASFAPGPGAPWYEPRSIRLVLTAGSFPHSGYDPGAHLLTVQLPQAETADVRVSCYLEQGDLREMAIWQLIEDTEPPTAQLEDLRRLVTRGGHWMLTPYRRMSLVHAVRRPLATPEFGAWVPQRTAGQTFARFTDAITLHRKSTGQLDVQAGWTEQIDNGPGSGNPGAVPRTVTMFSASLQRDSPVTGPLAIDQRHEFGDTRHRLVTYTASATSAFTRFFEERSTVALFDAPVVVAGAGLVPGSVRVTDETGEYAEGRDYTVDLARGSITRTDPSGIAAGASVHVDHVVPPVTAVCETPAVRHIPSSARPAAPKVRYVLPTYAWSSSGGPGRWISTRTGNGLRVYLDRPWWSSGEGELLGVVLERNPTATKTAAVRERLRTMVTLVGEDPIHLTSSALVPTSYPRAVATGTALTLDGAPEPVDVVGHQVGFDSDRGLWFCDIEMQVGLGYAPLVRLALVRYQPDSLPGLHLSPVVPADFLPLPPNRSVTVTSDPANPTRVNVSVTGPSYMATAAATGLSTMVATAQVREPDVEGELGWVDAPAPAAPVTLSASPDQGNSTAGWQGVVTLASPVGPGGTQRVVVEEFERLSASTSGDGVAQVDRLIFTDAVVVDTSTA